MTRSSSTPTHISEMVCHVHYKGFGAMTLHALLSKEVDLAQTTDEKMAIEMSAYLSWPFNCTRDGWRVYCDMEEWDVREWKRAMEEWGRSVENGEEDGDLKTRNQE